MKSISTGYLAWLLLMALALSFSCAKQKPPAVVRDTRTLMGTYVTIVAAGDDHPAIRKAVDDAFLEIARIEALMSPYRKTSDVALINSAAPGEKIKVNPETMDVLVKAREISTRTLGAFDVTMASLHGLWSFDPASPRMPSGEEIADRVYLVSYERVLLYPDESTVELKEADIKIDLGGIAKGYAADRAAQVLKRAGVKSALIDAGGDILTVGINGDRPWRVGIRDPRNPDANLAVILAQDQAVTTSGDYEKFFVKDGVRYCHIIDPHTGWPASSTRSVTIVTEKAWRADALATGVFVMGPEKGLELVERLPGVEAFIIDAEGKYHISSGLKNKIEFPEE